MITEHKKKYMKEWRQNNKQHIKVYPLSKAYQDYLETGQKRVYTIDDVQPLCKPCNSRKHTEIIKLCLVKNRNDD